MKRTVDTNIWVDAKVERLTSFSKLLWIYLLTSPQGNLAGCFELTMRRVEVDTGMKTAQVQHAMDELCAAGLIAYSAETCEVLIVRWSRHNWSSSPKLKKPLTAAIESVKEGSFRAYLGARFAETFDEQLGEVAKPQENTLSIPYTYPSISISNTDTVSKEDDEGTIPNPSQVRTGKRRYGEFGDVLLTDDELSRLQERFPDDWKERIEDLSNYIGSVGDKYKSHYRTILNWERKNAPRKEVRDERFAKYD